MITLGRIKTQQIKRTAQALVQRHSCKFSATFTDNKKIVEQVASIPSKKMRNIVAGYVTRLVKR